MAPRLLCRPFAELRGSSLPRSPPGGRADGDKDTLLFSILQYSIEFTGIPPSVGAVVIGLRDSIPYKRQLLNVGGL